LGHHRQIDGLSEHVPDADMPISSGLLRSPRAADRGTVGPVRAMLKS
jgi:hypothetical protein